MHLKTKELAKKIKKWYYRLNFEKQLQWSLYIILQLVREKNNYLKDYKNNKTKLVFDNNSK